MPPTGQTCSTCINYYADGTCHHAPPQMLAQDSARQAKGGYHIERYSSLNFVWPQTQPTDWCAQWDK